MADTDLSVANRPMSAKELTDKAREFDWNPSIALKYWVRAAETIHHEGQIYLREGNFSQAYFVLFRYSTLVLEYLASHPEANQPEARRALKPLQKRIPHIIEILETLRPEIEDSYDRWMKHSEAQNAARDARGSPLSPYERHAANDPGLSWSYASPARILDPGAYQDLAVDLAKQEMRRRRRAAEAFDQEENRLRVAGRRDSWNREPIGRPDPQYMDDDDLQRQMEATRRQLDRSRGPQNDDEGYVARPATYYYPAITKSTPLQYERLSSPHSTASPKPQPPRPPKELPVDEPSASRYDLPPRLRRVESPKLGPDRPRKELAVPWEPLSPIKPPPRPEKESLSPPRRPDADSMLDKAPALPPKIASEPPKERRITFQPAAYLENGHPIRPVFLPSTLRATFLEIAADNTRKGLELCGVLCGTQVNNALFITHLVIPEQRCTPDTCETENESGMLNYCIENDLIVIGWIHTHPTQSCFMSSRDLHTQAGYQVMMPESIAIVCAPKHTPSWGIFRLTNPPGLPHILDCPRTETFHQHSIDSSRLYTEAGNPPGHVYESKTMEFEVCDLRPNQY
ncbi:hypothetical protein VTK26DRAFT_7772 [Humicola hyalothermophila]